MRTLFTLPEDFLTCKVCGQTFTSQQWLTRHLKKKHGYRDLAQYTVEQYLNGEEPKCQCEHCDETVQIYIKDNRIVAPEYAHGHNFRNPETRAKAVTLEAKQKQKASREKTLHERYGITNAFQLSDSKAAAQKSHSPEAKTKRKSTLLSKYGVDQNFKRAEVIQAHCTEEANKKRLGSVQKTNLEKYGVKTVLQFPENLEKARSAKAQEKKRRTNLERFGYEYKILDPEVRNKFHKTSKGEDEIVAFLTELGVKVEQSKRKYLGQLELDIYLPDYSVGIEYDGLYWHSEELGKEPEYHLNKTLKAETEHIHLIHIFEDEWEHKQDIVKDRLKSVLGIQSRKLYARKCEIRQISSIESGEFFNQNHIQGTCKSNVRYGAYFGGELVACCSFGKPRSGISKNNEQGWELLRFCTKQGTSVVGILPKILKQFHQDHPEIINIYSFADRRYSTVLGNVYEKTGFILESVTKPNYWYFQSGKLERKHRSLFMKHKLLEMGWGKKDQTEEEIMHQNHFYKIWDCGTIKYRYFY